MTEGAGIQNNLTLNCVCIECNSYLGAILDEPFGRDSIEGILRFTKGKKKSRSIQNQRWIRAKLQSRIDPEFAPNVESKLLADGSEYFLRANSQVQIRSIDSGKIESFEETQFNSLMDRRDEFDFSTLTLIASESLSDSQWQILKAKVEDLLLGVGRKIEASLERQTPSRMEEPHLQGRYDDILQRAISKIAFNYMAVVFNKLDPSMIFSSDLDEMRNYIRYGVTPSFDAVEEVQESMDAISTTSHVVRFQCTKSKANTMVASARICLFNQIVWQVILSKDLRNTNMSRIASGHQWCFDAAKCSSLYYDAG